MLNQSNTTHRDFRLLCMWVLGLAALAGSFAAVFPRSLPCDWPVLAVCGILALVAIAWSPK
jgi:hypothetical protein